MNTILIKRGTNVPIAGDLQNGELGYAQNGVLYIGQIDENYPTAPPVPIQLAGSIRINTTLETSSWVNKTYTIDAPRCTPLSIVHIGMRSPSDAQAKAWGAANILPVSQEDNLIVIRAMGNVPNIDIPIVCVIGG